MKVEPIFIRELSVCLRVHLEAHSLSNVGTNGSNRLLPRRQLLADGTWVDAISGAIIKHNHAAILADYLEGEEKISLCPACAARDPRRAAALADDSARNLTMSDALHCGLCDTHGFLLPGKKQAGENAGRQRLSKSTIIDFAYALSVPGCFAESDQLRSRAGDADGTGQMLMKNPCRSGSYAVVIRYTCANIGVSTEDGHVVISDPENRLLRHQYILRSLCDQMLSPDGALTAGMLPHLRGIMGAIVAVDVGRAPVYSPLEVDFVEKLTQIVKARSQSHQVWTFDGVGEFAQRMEYLVAHSRPSVACSK